MEVFGLLQVLWRFRIAVAVGAVVAIALAFAFARGGSSRTGVASMRVVLDTPKSLTVDVNPPGMDTLEWRSVVLADLASTEESRKRIADQLGIPFDSLVVSAPYLVHPEAPFPLPRAASDAAAVAPEPYGLAIGVDLPPIIEIDSRAPDRELAAQLARAAADSLEAAATVEVVPGKTQAFVVDSAGEPQAHDVVSGPSRRMPAIVAFVVFALWCAAIVLVAAVARVRADRARRMAAPTGGLGWS
jgi:hypothetical protein